LGHGFSARLASLALVVTLTIAGAVVGGSQALAGPVSCGDTITTDTTLDSGLLDCPNNGIVIGADDITLDLNGHTIDLPPAKHMLVVRNDDRPGMIAFVAGVLADAGVNIDDMHLGRSDRGEAAIQVIATDVAVPPEVRDAIRAGDGVVSVHGLS